MNIPKIKASASIDPFTYSGASMGWAKGDVAVEVEWPADDVPGALRALDSAVQQVREQLAYIDPAGAADTADAGVVSDASS